MSITKIVLTFLLFFILLKYLTKIKNEIEKNTTEKYIEKPEIVSGKIPSVLFFSDHQEKTERMEHIIKSFGSDNKNYNYQDKIKNIFKLTNEDYKDLVDLPSDNKTKINLKKDWRTILNNEIDSINNNIEIEFTNLSKKQIDSQLEYEISSTINEMFEYQMDKFELALEKLINDDKEEYVLKNTDFNNLFENKEFDYYTEYEKNEKKYDTTGHLIKFTDNPLNMKTELSKQNDKFFTYEVHCGYDEDDKDDKEDKDDDDYHKKYKRTKIKKKESFPFKLVEYSNVTEELVNKFKKIEDIILSRINNETSLIISSDTLKKVKTLNIINNFIIVDRKINYILKNTDNPSEFFYNGEIVIYRGRNHGIHIKIDSLKQDNKYYITNYKILGIVISDKIEKNDTITDNIINPLYYKFHDKHVIDKNDIEKELSNIIDQSSLETFSYLFSKFKKLRSDRHIMINDFELLIYTGKILLDIEKTTNLKKTNEVSNPSIYTRIFGN